LIPGCFSISDLLHDKGRPRVISWWSELFRCFESQMLDLPAFQAFLYARMILHYNLFQLSSFAPHFSQYSIFESHARLTMVCPQASQNLVARILRNVTRATPGTIK